jgi:hypothetical protein
LHDIFYRVLYDLYKPDLIESRITKEIGLPAVKWRKTGIMHEAVIPADRIAGKRI